MTTFFFDGQAYDAKKGESVLDTIVRSGNPINYSCKKGACKTCLVQHVGGQLPVGAQRGLSVRLKTHKYLCACQCAPVEGLKLKAVMAQDLFMGARLLSRVLLTNNTMKLVVKLSEMMDCKPGQYLHIRRFDGLTRSYAIARVLEGNIIELHINRKYNGQFSGWLFNTASIGEKLLVQGPFGQCRYLNDYQQDKLIVIGHGAGIGAALGIVEQALAQGHVGEIYLYHGARNVAELYLNKHCLALMMAHQQLTYTACITGSGAIGSVDARCVQAQPSELAASQHPVKPNNRIFLCGEPAAVVKAQQQVFLAGFNVANIHVLPFEYKDLRVVSRG
ncbi:2Fe-2S iron-sulfur cluster-binding protein [Shewanella youngdeokensis]|uniref:2Fe-2S iron-sulfur cluster-binding protein n=1 Tax=Shewanella youngdeokensis TaxID=2999068 RepID=A0ABZ0K3T3_9GAMM|nr:2Fe-2S iron-sulfur cluster-binding protein [Shewanella sp. DAU334]